MVEPKSNRCGVLLKEKERDTRPGSLSTTRGHNEKTTVCKPGRALSTGIESASTWILDFAASRTVGNKFLSLKSPAYGILSWQLWADYYKDY